MPRSRILALLVGLGVVVGGGSCGESATTNPVRTHQVEVGLSGTGAGVVTASPPGTECTPQVAPCRFDVEEGTTVTFSAVPSEGSVFDGWGGDATGSGSSTTLTVLADRTVEARFRGRVDRAGAVARARSHLVDTLASRQATLALAPGDLLPPGTEIASLSAPGDPVLVVPDSAYFFFVDPYPAYMYAHPVLYGLVDAGTGVVTTARASDVPIVAGDTLYRTFAERMTSPDRFEPSSSEQVFAAPASPVAAAARLPVPGRAAARLRSLGAPSLLPNVRSAEDDECRKVAVLFTGHDDDYIVNAGARMGAFLEGIGFEVHSYVAGVDTFDEENEGYREAADGLGPCDKFLFYFVGHTPLPDEADEDDDGAPDEGRVDDLLWGQGMGEEIEGGISLPHFSKEYLDFQTAGTVNVIIDACYAGSVIEHLEDPFSDRFGPALQPGVDVHVFASASPTRPAFGAWNWERLIDYFDFDPSELMSEYTEHLLEELQDRVFDDDGDGEIDTDEFEEEFQDAHDRVAEELEQDPRHGRFEGPTPLSVNVVGEGTGRVTSDPEGIDCTSAGGECTLAVERGTEVTLQAVPSAGSSFTGWSGGASGTDETVSVYVDDATTVTAEFAVEEQTSIELDFWWQHLNGYSRVCVAVGTTPPAVGAPVRATLTGPLEGVDGTGEHAGVLAVDGTRTFANVVYLPGSYRWVVDVEVDGTTRRVEAELDVTSAPGSAACG